MTEQWVLVPPENFEDHDWLVAESRGVFLAGHLGHGDRRFPVIVYDRHRLALDAERETVVGLFYEPNLILVPEVTEESVTKELDRLARNGRLDWLLALTAEQETVWSLDLPDALDRGVISARLRHGERTFPVLLCDPEGAASVAGRDVGPYEENMIVVPELTEETMRRAVEKLGSAGQFRWMLN
ncbi:hypothetical protein [Allokutzneria sp. NRRL B-24872]|uniref:hypothetical protein n=1 Tax=Allokutzneria sp. NRRL B-24872 TaxID=1137961 RepID=UPI000A3BFF07|nr:hypothetical protein [Allokutzneria sp. NRRL B-24872]